MTVSDKATMETLVLEGPGRFEVREVPIPQPGAMQVLCRVRAVGICGTDPHLIEGDHADEGWPPSFPFTPGHEWAGEVVSVGPGAELLDWEPGDRVAGTAHAACGYCDRCVDGRYNLCEHYGNPALHSHYGHNTTGSYATYVVHSIKCVFKIPDAMPFDEAAVVDPASISLHAAKRGAITPGATVLVTGAGVIGLLAADCAHAMGAGRVILAGRGDRLRVAAELGHETVDVTQGDPVAAVRGLTGGRGVDSAIECAGAVETARWCMGSLRRGGRCVVVGVPLENMLIPLKGMVLDELELVGARASPGVMPEVLSLVADGQIRLKPMITHHFPLSDFAEAYDTFTERKGGALKVIIEP